MTPEQRIEENSATYWRLRPTIDRTYPKGWAVAIDAGRIIADARTFEELEDRLRRKGPMPARCWLPRPASSIRSPAITSAVGP